MRCFVYYRQEKRDEQRHEEQSKATVKRKEMNPTGPGFIRVGGASGFFRFSFAPLEAGNTSRLPGPGDRG